MARLGLTITNQMANALNEEAEKTGAPIASLARMALEEFLESRGYEINTSITWGGKRRGEDTRERKRNPAQKHGIQDLKRKD